MPGIETSRAPSPETEPMLSPQTKETVKEWTKFVESPTSSLSSPGPKPVNFDFQRGAVEKDPKILHPVALRVTPESTTLQNDESHENVEGYSPKKFLEGHNNQNLQGATQNNDIRYPPFLLFWY